MVATPSSIALIGEALVDAFPDRVVPGGAPFNVARNLAALGETPLLLSRTGADAHGQALAEEFERFGLDTAGLQQDGAWPTGHVTVRLDGTQHTFEIPPQQAWDRIDAGTAVAAVRTARPAIVYFGTLAQRSEASRAAVRAVLQATPALRFLDLNLRPPFDDRTLAAESLAQADIVKVNDAELQQLLGWFAPAADAHALLHRFGLQRLIVTRGADGWSCVDASAGELHGPSHAAAVVDTVGAGDAFSSVMLIGELRGWPLAGTLDRASRFAAGVCGLRGAVACGHALYRDTRTGWG